VTVHINIDADAVLRAAYLFSNGDQNGAADETETGPAGFPEVPQAMRVHSQRQRRASSGLWARVGVISKKAARILTGF